MSPSGVSKVVSDRSATTAAAFDPVDMLVDTPAGRQHHMTCFTLQNSILKYVFFNECIYFGMTYTASIMSAANFTDAPELVIV